MKLYATVATLLAFCLPISSFGRVRESSSNTFAELMNNETAYSHFITLQHNMLNTPSDNIFRRFLFRDPLLSQTFQALLKGQEKSLNEFSRSASVQMLRLVPGITPQLDPIRNMIVDLASDLGFPQSAIDNLELYVTDGPKNAFTVSGSPFRIIVVLEREIIDALKPGELRAVMAHELGHIRSGHVIMGQMNLMILSLLERIVTGGSAAPGAGGLGLEGLLSQSELAMNIVRGTTCVNGCSVQHGSWIQQKTFRALNVSPQMMAMRAPLEMAFIQKPEAVIKLLLQYLDISLHVLDEMGASSDVQQYFADIQQRLPNAGSAPFVNAAQFAENATILLHAYSRAFETSSDRISASVVKNDKMASAFARLLGAPFSLADRRKILTQLKAQANQALDENTIDDFAEDMGGTHPALNLRILQMLTMPSYPTVFFANPFTRVLLLHESMTTEQLRLEKLPASTPEIQKWAEQQLKKLKLATNETRESILQLLNHWDFRAPAHPRLHNLIEFMLARKEVLLATKQEFLEANEALKAQAAVFDMAMEANSILVREILPLFKKVPADQLTQERIELLQLALKSESIEDLRAARVSMRSPGGKPSKLPENLLEAIKAPAVSKARKAPDVEQNEGEDIVENGLWQPAAPALTRGQFYCDSFLGE